MVTKDKEEIKILIEAGYILASILHKLSSLVKPSISSIVLDRYAENLILEAGGIPSFKGYVDKESEKIFPASLCVSLNEEVVHGIPNSKKFLREGDIVGLDLGMKWPAKNGLYVDAAITLPVGKISPENNKLIEVCRSALYHGISKIKHGGNIGDIGFAIQSITEKNEFSIVKNLVGHGVGKKVHEEPMIPNWGKLGQGIKIKKGMVLAIEPMITIGKEKVILDKNGWTWKTADKSFSAHFEHTILVTENGTEILTKI